MKWMAVALLVIVAIVLVAVRVDYAFYNPTKGVAAAGRAEKAVDPHERELLRITVSDAEIARFKGKVTLNALSELYGTKDSLRCSASRQQSSRPSSGRAASVSGRARASSRVRTSGASSWMSFS